MYTKFKAQGEMAKNASGGKDLQKLFLNLKEASPDKCKSLLKKHLTQERYDKLKDKKTRFGGTLADCIQSGCLNLDSGVGIYACDPEAYTVFADVFDEIIKDYHKVPKLDHPEPDMGDLDKLDFGDLDPSRMYIKSTRVRVGRSHDSYGFPPVLTKEDCLKMESDTKAAFDKLTGDLAGTYYPLAGMSKEIQKKLTEDHFLFKDDDRFLRDAGGYNNWPAGRGIFFNEKKNFLVWVNEEDHLRLISMQEGGDLAAVYKRLCKAINTMTGSGLKFAKRKGLGYLTFCPSNLGTALRASVHMAIPHLAAQPDFKEFCEKLHIQPRGIHGEHTESVGGVYDLSNKRRLGLTEFEAVQEMKRGVEKCLEREKELERQHMFSILKNAPADKCKSLLKKHLTQERYDKLKDKKTKFGGTIYECIRSGCKNLDSGVGIYACDPEGYTVFADVLDEVIKDYHKVPKLNHPEPDMGDLDKLDFGDLDPSRMYIKSTRVRVGRSHDSYGFPPVLSKENCLKMEADTKAAFGKFTDELAGKYYPLTGMTKEDQKQLTEDHFLFKDDDRFLRDAGGYSNWPTGRGIYFNDKKNFLVWVNEEDHLRIISMQEGGDLGAVYKRLCKAIKIMTGSGLKFAKRQGLGYLTFCPSNLGTALRASVHMAIPHLAAQPDFKEFCEKLHIQPRGIHGEHTESVGGVYDLSNKRRLGLTEFEAVQEMRRGVEKCLEREKELERQHMFSLLKNAPADKCKSLLKKHLTQERYDKLKDKKTKFGGTIHECIRSGCKNLDSGVGIYACDPEGYTVFADVLDEVIKDYHKVPKLNHPEPDMGDLDNLNLGDLDPSGKYIKSTRVRVGRSHDSYGFPPVLSREDCIKMESDTKAAFEKFTGELAGKYYPLEGMTKETQKQLTEDHFLFKDDDRFLRDAGGYSNWPTGRGIFFNEKKNFLVWVNEEDHLRIISMQEGGDLGAVYKRLCSAIKVMTGSGLKFAKRDGLGYLTFCPSNLGTALRASVHMKIPNLAAQPDFKEFCEKLHIQPRGIHGEHTESAGGVYDLSNKRRLGLTEHEAVLEMKRGVEKCLAREKELEKK